MSPFQPSEFLALYTGFEAPVTTLDCGARCAPHNEGGLPFCCDPKHAIPTLYTSEWDLLQSVSDQWEPWEAGDQKEMERLQRETPPGQLLAACRGPALCQRGFRSFICRSFPFFPYLNRQGEFLGLSYYWQYEDRCWVISNLGAVQPEYRQQFIQAFEQVFEREPDERENFRYNSIIMRRVFGRRRRSIPLLHRNGGAYKVSPRTGRMRLVAVESLPKFGPYGLAAELPFADELGE